MRPITLIIALLAVLAQASPGDEAVAPPAQAHATADLPPVPADTLARFLAAAKATAAYAVWTTATPEAVAAQIDGWQKSTGLVVELDTSDELRPFDLAVQVDGVALALGRDRRGLVLMADCDSFDSKHAERFTPAVADEKGYMENVAARWRVDAKAVPGLLFPRILNGITILSPLQRRITLSLEDTPLSEAVRQVSTLAGMGYCIRSDLASKITICAGISDGTVQDFLRLMAPDGWTVEFVGATDQLYISTEDIALHLLDCRLWQEMTPAPGHGVTVMEACTDLVLNDARIIKKNHIVVHMKEPRK